MASLNRRLIVCLGWLAGAGLVGLDASATPPSNFTNWESPHVSPLAVTPDGTRLLAVNTADARLEVFSITGPKPIKMVSIPVGLDPVSVRVLSNSEAWVVNHISDSVSIVNLTSMTVTATLKTADEPWDVVFAGAAGGKKGYVSCGTTKVVMVFDPANLGATPVSIPILGEMPRAMGVSPDGLTVYVAIFESGNNTTVLGGGASGTNIGFPPLAVNNTSGPYAGANPPPNSGVTFSPPIAAQNTTPNPLPPKVALIVRKNSGGQWMDDNAHNWTNFVSGTTAPTLSGRVAGWDLYDDDVAMIATSNNAVTYVHGLMNLCMGIAINPANGRIAVVGTEATNEVRFEPVLTGRFVRVKYASVDPAIPSVPSIVDLNAHLLYNVGTLPQSERDKSIGDPRGIVFDASGTTAYISGMGSNNVIVTSATGARTPADNVINVGEGPTGLALDAGGGRLFVMNKFDATISTVDTATRSVIATTPFFDPTPTIIKVGRKHLYNTHKNSGLGQVACASCHIDATMDRLAWDLGNPTGSPVAVDLSTRNLGQGLFGLEPNSTTTPFQPYHPMKGPLTTQTLQDIVAHEPFHWRGDKLGLEEFNAAFIGLQGDDVNLTPTEMQEFEDFLSTLTFPPNPYRNFDNSLPTNLPLPGHFATGRFTTATPPGLPAGAPLPAGNAVNGLAAYRSQATRLDMNAFACVTCHTLPTGEGTDMRQGSPFGGTGMGAGYAALAAGPNGEHHLQLVSTDGLTNVTMKTPQLRNEYKKVGFNATQSRNTVGFGVLHDGSVDSIERFVSEPVFNVSGDQMVADLTAFILAFSGSELPQGSATTPLEPPGTFSKDTHAAVGAQTTAAATIDTAKINQMIALADANKVGIIAKGLIDGRARGYKYNNGTGMWKADRAADPLLTTATLEARTGPNSPLTFTVVVLGQQTRLGIDRDEDGWLDRDEATVCSDSADPAVHPGTPLCLDADGDLAITVNDIFAFINAWFAGPADFNRSGATDVQDLFDYLNAWFIGCPL